MERNHFFKNLYDTKKLFHRNSAKLSFEQKVENLIELQKIAVEMGRANPNRKNKLLVVWNMTNQ